MAKLLLKDVPKEVDGVVYVVVVGDRLRPAPVDVGDVAVDVIRIRGLFVRLSFEQQEAHLGTDSVGPSLETALLASGLRLHHFF
jgi:hypothetical protein